MRTFLLLGILLLWLPGTRAQDQPALILSNTQIGRQADGFGGEMPVAYGDVYNFGSTAYASISLILTAHSADDAVIGEGFGYLVDACGNALLDYALPPNQLQRFSAPFELFAEGAVERLQFEIDAMPVPHEAPPPLDLPAVRQISADEVVMLEWIDEQTLIYGSGCDGAVFTELDWWRHRLDSGTSPQPIEHPAAQRITPEMIAQSGAGMVTQSGEQNPALFYGSQMRFPPNARRIVYQNDLHTILSAEPDGSFKRLIHDGLHQHCLRGFLWGADGVFLAYYFGAYGDEVRYFTGSAGGELLMGRLEDLPASQTIPGLSADGLALVVGREIDGVSGYFWQTAYGESRLLFEAALPGSHYPPPLLFSAGAARLIYLMRPLDGVPSLQCFNRSSGELHTLTALPLQLTRTARAWAWLSPRGSRLAIAANGTSGGLWTVDLSGECG